MDYLDCKGLSEAWEINGAALGFFFVAGCRLEGLDLAPALFELIRRREAALVAYDKTAAIYLARLPKNQWSRPVAVSHMTATAGAANIETKRGNDDTTTKTCPPAFAGRG